MRIILQNGHTLWSREGLFEAVAISQSTSDYNEHLRPICDRSQVILHALWRPDQTGLEREGWPTLSGILTFNSVCGNLKVAMIINVTTVVGSITPYGTATGTFGVSNQTRVTDMKCLDEVEEVADPPPRPLRGHSSSRFDVRSSSLV